MSLCRVIVLRILAKGLEGAGIECCDHSDYPVLGLKILHTQGNESTWNGWALTYHSYINFKSNATDNSQSHGKLSLV